MDKVPKRDTCFFIDDIDDNTAQLLKLLSKNIHTHPVW
jgi:hypothetical protein